MRAVQDLACNAPTLNHCYSNMPRFSSPGHFLYLVCLLQIFWSSYPINGGFLIKRIGPFGDLQLYLRQTGSWKSLIHSAEQIQELLEAGIMPNQEHFLS